MKKMLKSHLPLNFACMYFCFLFSFSLAGEASTFVVQKLTGQGLVQIRIKEPKEKSKIKELNTEKSLLDLTIDRQVRSLENSKWQGLKKNQKNLKIAVIGDTGCRLKEGKDFAEYQNCLDPKEWPFETVMKSIQKDNPDLILHLGDYHYREQCTKEKPCKAMTAAVGYQWEPWKLDFFSPAKKLLESKPWIFVRGNHEDCNRAYYGYNRTLSTRDNFENCTVFEEPDYIELRDLLIVNLDTSSLPESIDPNKENKALWLSRFQKISDEIDKRKPTTVWLVTHKPFFGLAKFGENIVPTNVNLKSYLQASPLLPKLSLLFAGHIHLSQIIRPVNGPLQFVLGTGGTKLDVFNETLSKERLAALDLDSVFTEKPGFGYALFRQQKTKWKVEFKNQFGKQTSACELNSELKVCRPLP